MARLGRGYPVRPHIDLPGRFVTVVPIPPPANSSVLVISESVVTATATSAGIAHTSVLVISLTDVLVTASGRALAAVLSVGQTKVSVYRNGQQLVAAGPAIGRTVVYIRQSANTPDQDAPPLSTNDPIGFGVTLTGSYSTGEAEGA